MNGAHWHLLVNHLPIVGGMITFLVFLYGSIVRNPSIVKLGNILFVLVAVFSFIAVQTGEGAEEYLKSLKAIDSDDILETHVHAAEIANYAMIAVGLVSLLTLLIKRMRAVIYMPWITLALAAFAMVLMIRAGNLGGEIMHKEIRSNTIKISAINTGENINHGKFIRIHGLSKL